MMECNRGVRVAGRLMRQDVRQRLMQGEVVVVELVGVQLRSRNDAGSSSDETEAQH
jgi:hypothetical protein